MQYHGIDSERFERRLCIDRRFLIGGDSKNPVQHYRIAQLVKVRAIVVSFFRMHAAKIVRNLNCRWSSVLRTGTRPIHRSDDATPHVVKDLHVGKTPITAQLWQMRLAQRSCEGGAESAIDRPVLTKTAKDSRLSLRYKFSSDWQLKDLYADHMGNVLIGKLLEDLDALAGNIAITHAEDDLHNRRLAMVTASVDRIVQQKAISITDDLILTGQVVWVGRSSLDVIIELHKAGKDGTDINPDDLLKDSSSRLLSSFFTYVARDRITGKAATVHKLQLETPTEVSLHSERQKVADARKSKQPALARTQQSYEALSQLVESGSAIEDMPALAHPNAVLMKLTALENSFICQPQNVNTSRRVFGGFLSESSV